MTSVAEPTSVDASAAPSAGTGAGAAAKATISVRHLWKVFGPAEDRLATTSTTIPSAESIDAAEIGRAHV